MLWKETYQIPWDDLIGGNKFTGMIPPGIVKLRKLQRIVLSNNRLTGSIPASIGNLSMLDEVHLENNELNGTIPSSFGNCPMLVLLDLSQNNLSGTIPNQFFHVSPFSVKLNLSQNHLVGSLPAGIGALKTLVKLDVSENELSGLIPTELYDCSALESLYMRGNFIQGFKSQPVKKLRALQNIDLSRNNLSGKIPDFFETLHLKYLNLSWNNLEGDVPKKGLFANASAYSIVGNRLCGGIPELQLPRCSSYSPAYQIIVVLLGLVFILLIFTILLHIYANMVLRSVLNRPISVSPITLSYKQLHQATNGFSKTNLVSKGASGLVYKGKIGPQYNKRAVAIKVFNEEATNCFITEIEALQNIHHRNIVKIMSICSTIVENRGFKAIVYNVTEHRSLEWWLHSKSMTSHDKLQILNLSTRINIAIDVANALDYLHNSSDNPLIHCNLTSSNIWLDTDMCAHVSNFGLAKYLTDIGSDSQAQIRSGAVRTPGYKPPEYCLRSSMSTKGDVYSYGLILLEMLTGKKTTDPMFNEGYKLQNFVSSALSDGVKDIIDPVNLHELSRDAAAHAEDSLSMLFNIGVKCTLEMPQFRPDIRDTLSMLKTVRINFKANHTTEAYARTSSLASVIMAQRNMKSLPLYGITKMAPNSRSMSTLSSVVVSYVDLHKATNGFSLTNLVGAGGYGSVYKGRFLLGNSGLEDGTGTAVAIKVFNLQRRGAVKSFNTEYGTLKNIHHPNLVKTITTCTSVDKEGGAFRAILYEFMDHGSLEMWLHPRYKNYYNGPLQPHILSLHARIDIAVGVASALSYLHHQCEHSIIHCDLKPGNILLDKNMVAHIADFGLAISLPKSPELNQLSSSAGMRGTLGYIPPEYGLGCKMTTKGDTYSFGILLLEMLTRMKPTHRMFRKGLNLHNFVWMAFPNNIVDITDPLMKIRSSANEGECLTRLFNIGLACSKISSKDRPDMHAVLLELKSIRNSFQLN
ncbi:probable LRR receptor-like serine/threonine-protein kinase At3g47570 isoform X3 [Daucus carota subsp. sativus]|uniref:probable LRR receptor-like serine/threonine-protein kinase At3g47570 isoform X3 n=1 Tax=Daucus carota subsp. sativus TaxID=79200 RepID=UPI0030833EA8